MRQNSSSSSVKIAKDNRQSLENGKKEKEMMINRFISFFSVHKPDELNCVV